MIFSYSLVLLLLTVAYYGCLLLLIVAYSCLLLLTLAYCYLLLLTLAYYCLLFYFCNQVILFSLSDTN
jgi:hypothetical protein